MEGATTTTTTTIALEHIRQEPEIAKEKETEKVIVTGVETPRKTTTIPAATRITTTIINKDPRLRQETAGNGFALGNASAEIIAHLSTVTLCRESVFVRTPSHRNVEEIGAKRLREREILAVEIVLRFRNQKEGRVLQVGQTSSLVESG